MSHERTTTVPTAPAPAREGEAGYRGILDILAEMGDSQRNPNADQPAFIISRYFAPNRQEQAVTFRDLHRDIGAMAAVYRDMGMGQSSRIALAETNSREFFGSYFGGLAVGATLVSINLLALQDESSTIRYLTHMLSSPRLGTDGQPGVDLFVIGDDPTLSKLHGLHKVLRLKQNPLVRKFLNRRIGRFAEGLPPAGLDHLVFRLLARRAKTPRERRDLQVLFSQLPARMRMLTPAERARRLENTHPMHPINPSFPAEKTAEVLFTSGTSGYPKGVALTHGNLAFTVQSLTEGTGDIICENDVLLMGLPFFHIFGKAVMLAALSRQMEVARRGGSVQVVILPSLSRAIQNLDGVLKTIQDYRVTLLPTVPIFLEKLVHYLRLHPHKRPMLESLRIVISGGAALKPDTCDTLKGWLPQLRIIEGYGSSEGGINLLNKEGSAGYVGMPLPGVETRLVPSGGEPGLEASTGELWVRSGGVSAGYVPGTADSADLAIAREGGWFHTGDLVAWHPEHGYKIHGRESFFIKIDNEKRAPGELEEAIRLASPRVLDAWAVAHRPGPGEKAVAVVVTRDADATEDSLKQAMNQLAKDNLITRWKIPRHILVLHRDTLPSRFDQPFKREAAYKFVRQFIEEAVAGGIVAFHDEAGKARASRTEVVDPAALERLADQYDA